MNRDIAPHTGGSKTAGFRQEINTMKLQASPKGVRIKTRFLNKGILARLRRGDRGQAMVELALSLPVLLVLLTGLLSFGIAINNYLQLTDAVGAGGRYLSLRFQQTVDPCADAATTVINAAPTLAKAGTFTYKLTMFNTLASGGGQLGSYSVASCPSASNTTGAAGNLVANGSVQLTVSYPCNLWVYGYIWPNCKLTASITELVQQ